MRVRVCVCVCVRVCVQAGFWQSMLMLFLGYLVVVLTVLSISAIATSATVEGGGVYCIYSLGYCMKMGENRLYIILF